MPSVLLIDDNPLIKHFVQLAVPEWHVVHALTGRKGLALLREQQTAIDVVVLDVGLPGMDGRLVCARIRDLVPTMPIVPFTGNDLADDELREMGCVPAVLKSASPPALGAALQAALGHVARPPIATPLMRFVQEYAAQVEQAENRGPPAEHLSAEAQPIHEAHLDDLDLDLVNRHISQALAQNRYAGVADPLEYLRRHRCLSETALGLTPTLIGVVMFAAEPERWISAAGVDIIEFSQPSSSPALVRFQQELRGPLVALISQAVEWLWIRSGHAVDALGAEGLAAHAYPLAVLRELTINALAHRDWSYRGSTVRIQVFPAAIEWVTPGGLPFGVTAANLRTAQVSRNPALMQLLRHAGLAGKLGLGIDAVEDRLRAEGGEALALADDGSFVTFRVEARYLADQPGQSMAAPAFTPRQTAILHEIRRRHACSTADLAATLGETMRTIQRELKLLVEAGQLAMVGETHTRRYRLRQQSPAD